MRVQHTYQYVIVAIFFVFTIGFVKAQPSSDFSIDTESWNTVGQCPVESSPGATWQSAGGNPDGHIKAQDNSVGIFYWFSGGAEWKNDLSAYYDCFFYFDLKQSDAGLPTGSQYDLMILRGDDQAIVKTFTPDPATSWTTFVIGLNETGWTLGGPLDADDCPDLGGAAVTYAEFISYLSDVKRFRIRAEYSGLSNETNRLDNVFIDCDPLLLPLVMGEFGAKDIGFNKAELNWSTVLENETNGFQIEKSTDGLNFDSIGYVNGYGTTTSTQTYSFIDQNFVVTSYYRLRQVDNSGTGFYSEVVALNTNLVISEYIGVFPNPANNYINIKAYQKEPLTSFRVFDISGNLRFAGNFTNVNGCTFHTLDLTQFENGLYIIEMSNQLSTFISRFEVLK